MAFLKAISPSTWLVILIAVIVIGVGWKLNHDKKEIKSLERTVVVQDGEIKSKDDVIVVGQVVDTVEEKVHVDVAKETRNVISKSETVIKQQDVVERDITHKFDSLPETVENVIAQQESLSQTRIISVWDTYCAVNPDAKECPVAPTPEGDKNA